ncbi:MAG: hypothetical protein HQK76_15950 [Desulfobacterales bacterium]|nr:hypothetical protein [Desulfobacterales bacterium]
MKKLFLLTLVMGVFCFALNANAATEYYTCSIVAAGPGWGGYLLKISDTAASPAFTNKWCLFPTNQEKEMLATALTAIANNLKVGIYVDNSLSGYPTISSMYLQAQ